MIVSALLGVLSGLLRAGMRAHALRVLGMVALLGMLSACSAPTKEEVEADRKTRESLERYLNEVYGRLRAKWKQHLAQSPNDGARGCVRVVIYLSKTGNMEHLHVKNNPNTDPVLTKFTVKAIQDTKFPPVPEELIPWLKKFRDGRMGMGIIFNTNRDEKGGVAASGAPPLDEETKRQMEKRWGVPPDRGGSASRGGVDEVSVKLASKESGVRQVVKQPPGTPQAKGGSTSGGTQTTVKLTATPKERYIQRVTQAVEKKWQMYRRMELAGITYGSLKVEFYVNKQGQVEDPRVVEDKYSYRALTLFTLRAIKDAEIPRMPLDVIPSLPMNDPERLKIEYNVLIY